MLIRKLAKKDKKVLFSDKLKSTFFMGEKWEESKKLLKRIKKIL